MEIKKTPKKSLADINMTPLVDTALVLLIIFMVTAPFIEQGIKVNLPIVKGDKLQKQERPIIVYLKNDKTILLNTKKIPEKGLEMRINLLFRNRKDKNIFIKADKQLPYGFVAKIISKIKEGGVRKIGLVTLPPETND